MQIVNLIFDILDQDVKIKTGNPSDFWNKYPALFNKNYNLSHKRIEQEVHKNCIGSNEKLIKEFGHTCQYDMKQGLFKIIDFQREQRND